MVSDLLVKLDGVIVVLLLKSVFRISLQGQRSWKGNLQASNLWFIKAEYVKEDDRSQGKLP